MQRHRRPIGGILLPFQPGVACRLFAARGLTADGARTGREAAPGFEKEISMLLIVLILLILLLGGGGWYAGGPRVGGTLGTILVIILILYLLGMFPR
jgi:hypothetical protein